MSEEKPIPWKRIAVESAAIVVSILLAFAIEAWWSNRQEEAQTRRMVAALKADFARTKEDLRGTIQRVEASIADANKLMASLNDETMSVDELRRLARNAVSAEFFHPSLTTYNSGVARGTLDLLESPDLQKAFSDFFYGWQSYSRVVEMSGDVFFNGAGWEVRRSIGELGMLYLEPEALSPQFQLSDAEYRTLLDQTEVYALFDNMLDLHSNSLTAFRDMDVAAGAILVELENE